MKFLVPPIFLAAVAAPSPLAGSAAAALLVGLLVVGLRGIEREEAGG